jgi:hypothetical protein
MFDLSDPKLVEITRSGGVWAPRAAKWLRPQHLTTPRKVG